MTNADYKRLMWERERANFEEYMPWMHPGGGTPESQGNTLNDYNTGNIFSESVAPFDNIQLVSTRAPVHDAAPGTVAPPGQIEVETLLSFSALLPH